MPLSRRTSVDESSVMREKLDAEIDHVLALSSSTSATPASHHHQQPVGPGGYSTTADSGYYASTPQSELSLSLSREEEAALLKEVGAEMDDDEQPGRPPAQAVGPDGGKLIIPAYIMIPIWVSSRSALSAQNSRELDTDYVQIALSGGVILMNKHMFSALDFPYPVFITSYHMLIASIGTRLLRLIPGRLSQTKVDVPWPVYVRTIVPLALLFSASLILSNVAYVHLSVSFVQMLKAWIPILVLVIQLIIGAQKYNHLLLVIIAMTSFGCSVAASGEIKFSIFGFSCQIAAVVVESCRLVLIQILLKDYSMSPLQSVALYAPLCALSIGALVPIMEGSAPFEHIGNVGLPFLLANGLVAFSLNIAGVFLIDSAGSLVLTLSGVCKDVLLITSSVIFLGSTVTGNQVTGYAIAVTGLLLFRLTGGNPSSPLGSKLAGLAGRILPPSAPGSPGNGPARSSQAWRKIVAVSGATIVGIAMLSHIGADHLRVPAYTLETSTNVLRQVTYPVKHDELVALDSVHYRGHFTRYVQNGPGRDIIAPFDSTVDPSRLPRLAWVIIATPDAIAAYGQELSALSCYAERVGIPFFIEHHIMVNNRNFMTARHRSVAKHLRYHQWVLATDADVLVANSMHDPREFLDDAVDVIFNDRDNREICACAYFVKNSPGGWSFLSRWMSWDDHGDRQNRDNGDLNEMVAAGVRPGKPNTADYAGRYSDHVPAAPTPEGETPCLNEEIGWPGYVKGLIKCLDTTFSTHRYGDDSVPYWDAALWSWAEATQTLPPVNFRAYKPLAGFMRPLEGPNASNLYAPYLAAGMPGDFLVSGKNLEGHLGAESLFCTGEEWRYPVQQWDVEQTRVHMATYGFTWWPGCFDEQGVNRCKEHNSATQPL